MVSRNLWDLMTWSHCKLFFSPNLSDLVGKNVHVQDNSLEG